MLLDWNCAVIHAVRQVVTAAMARAEVLRLVPRPGIGVAPPGGRTLVNIQTILWVDTPADRSLGAVRLLNHAVALRIHLQRVAWDFGDGTTDATPTPGRAYDAADPCRQALCAGYYGHVYGSRGPHTLTATVTWSGEFQVDGGAWQSIGGAVTGPAASQVLTVLEARSVLVPDPAR